MPKKKNLNGDVVLPEEEEEKEVEDTDKDDIKTKSPLEEAFLDDDGLAVDIDDLDDDELDDEDDFNDDDTADA